MATYKKLKYDNSNVQVQSAVEDGNGTQIDTNYLKLDGTKTMTGALQLKATGNNETNIGSNGIRWGTTSLPQDTAPQYVCTIDSFASGGRQKWASIADLKTALAVPTSYVSSVNGSTGAITDIAKTNADNAFSTTQTMYGSDDTPLNLRANHATMSNIALFNSSGTRLGNIGANGYVPYWWGGQGNNGQIALTSDIPTSIDGLSGGSLTSPLVISGGDATTAKKISIDQSASGQITDQSTATLFGFLSNNATTLTVGGNSYALNLRGSGTRPQYKGNDLALYSDLPSNTNYYPIRSYTSGLQISTYSVSTDCQLYVPYATADQFGVIKVGSGLSVSDGVLSATGGGGGVTTLTESSVNLSDLSVGTTYKWTYNGQKTINTNATFLQPSIAAAGNVVMTISGSKTASSVLNKYFFAVAENETTSALPDIYFGYLKEGGGSVGRRTLANIPSGTALLAPAAPTSSATQSSETGLFLVVPSGASCTIKLVSTNYTLTGMGYIKVATAFGTALKKEYYLYKADGTLVGSLANQTVSTTFSFTNCVCMKLSS